jgi:integrase/recombinase XerD
MILTNGSQKTGENLSEIEALFEQYVKEMRFLRNFSERTLIGYREVFKRWQKYAGGIPTADKLTDYVVGMRQAGLNTTTCNISIRATNAFLTWLKGKGIVTAELRLKKLPEEKKKMRVFSNEEIKAILAVRPSGINEQRVYAMACLFIDTGLRFSEARGVLVNRVSFDKLSITVVGKGSKERLIPMSLELRKVLYRYYTHHRRTKFESPYLFCTNNGTRVLYSNTRRDLRALFKKAKVSDENIDGFFHSFRRGFAKSYIRNGGSLSYLQVAMGHSSIVTTQLYISPDDEDIKNHHQKFSPMSCLR